MDQSHLIELQRAKLIAVASKYFDLDNSHAIGDNPNCVGVKKDNQIWILCEQPDGSCLLSSVALAQKQKAEQIYIFVSSPTTSLARWASYFVSLKIQIWYFDKTSAQVLLPTDLEPPAPLVFDPNGFVEEIEKAGARSLIQDGILIADVKGLEVARVVQDPDLQFRLRVGVGRNDRQGHAIMNPDAKTSDLLPRVVKEILTYRKPGIPLRKENTLCSQNWLRHIVINNPSLIGASSLSPSFIPGYLVGPNSTSPAVAGGFDKDGSPIGAIFYVGIDPQIILSAIDVRISLARDFFNNKYRPDDINILIVIPQGDDHPFITKLANLLHPKPIVTTVPKNWRSLDVDTQLVI